MTGLDVEASPIDDTDVLRQQVVDLQNEVTRLRQALAAAQAAAAMRAEPAGKLPAYTQDGADPCPASPLPSQRALSGFDLLANEDRLRAIVESAVDYAIVTADLQDRITGWNHGATRVFGWEQADAIGRPCRMIFTPEDCAAGVPEAEMREALANGKANDERWHIRRDGTRFWGRGELVPLHDGELLGYMKILHDCTEQRRAEDALREREQLYRLIVQSARDYAIFTTDLQGRITSWNRGATQVLGWEESEAIGRPNAILYSPEDHLTGVPEEEMAQALAEGHSERDRWHIRSDRTRIWGTEVVTPLQDGNGKAHGFLKILRDRTEQRHEEEKRQLLLAELNHRVKNTLAIVQSLAFQTARSAATPAEMAKTLDARLDALAAAYDLLTRQTWKGAMLAEVVQATLKPYKHETEQVRISGPDLMLRPNAALVLHMALHELATNAAKYGALSEPGGALSVTWSLDRPPDATGGSRLELVWTEQEGPKVKPEPQRGFGTRLIEDSVSYQLGGKAALRFHEQGVECRLLVPLHEQAKDA